MAYNFMSFFGYCRQKAKKEEALLFLSRVFEPFLRRFREPAKNFFAAGKKSLN